MRNISIHHLVVSASLYAEPERDISEVLQPLCIQRIEVDAARDAGLSSLGHLTGEGNLKITTSDGKKINSKGRSYFIAEQAGEDLVVESWSLTSETQFEYLKTALQQGKMLVTPHGEQISRTQVTYRILLTSKDKENLVLENDQTGLWYELCQAYFNATMRSLVRWETHPSSTRMIVNLLDTDLANSLVESEGLNLENFFIESMDRLFELEDEQVAAFVNADRWAFYYVGIDLRGVYISRHHDARAILWNREKLEEIENKERDA